MKRYKMVRNKSRRSEGQSHTMRTMDQAAYKKRLRGATTVREADSMSSHDAELTGPSANGSGKQVRQQYTGTDIIGFATLHKSNTVPIRSREQAVEVANMRRNGKE